MPRARPCGRVTLFLRPRPFGRGRLCSAPTTLRARATPDHGAVHGAQRPRQTCAMRRLSSRARIRATQCESERSTTGAMGECSPAEPLPSTFQDAVAAAIEDGATMDEIVAWGPCARRRGFGFDPARTTLRACATRRGPLGRADARPDLPAARDRSLCRGMGTRPRARRRGAQRPHRDRDPANAGAPHDGRARRARGAGADRGPRPPHARAPPYRKRRQAPHRARAGGGRSRRRARRSGRTRGPHDPCRTGRDRPSGHGGARLPWAHRPAAGGVRVGRRLCRGLSRHPAGVGARPACRRPLPRIHVSPRRSQRPIRLPTTGRRTLAMRWMYATGAIHGMRTGRAIPS